MPSTARARSSRTASTARNQILQQLKDDHARVKKAYREFQKLDCEEDLKACDAIVRQVLQELGVHAAVEEELLYPAARRGIADAELIDEADVEHESMHILIDQLSNMGADSEKFGARFTVLCEYVLHHVKEEEGEIFPQLRRARLDWENLAAEMDRRRQELAPVEEAPGTGRDPAVVQAEEVSDEDMAVSQGSAANRERSTPARRSSAARRT